MTATIDTLATEHPDLTFRQFRSRNEFLNVQAGIRKVEALALPPDNKTGFKGFAGIVERFHFVASASTPGELAAKL